MVARVSTRTPDDPCRVDAGSLQDRSVVDLDSVFLLLRIKERTAARLRGIPPVEQEIGTNNFFAFALRQSFFLKVHW